MQPSERHQRLPTLITQGNQTGRMIASEVCVPFRMIEGLMERLKSRRMVLHCGSASLNDYIFGLTEEGRRRAETSHSECAYTGPAPVPLSDYVISVEAQAICNLRSADSPRRTRRCVLQRLDV